MALIDTGLGWSADEDWLKSSDGFIGNIVATSAAYEGQPIPHTTSTYTDIRANGILAADGGGERQIYIGTITPGADLYLFHIGRVLYALTTTRYCQGIRNWRYEIYTRTETIDMRIPDVPGVWYGGFGQLYEGMTWYVPEFTSVEEAALALQSLLPLYKLNSGYSVGAFIRWRASPTTYNTSAILISTDPTYTVLSENGTTQSSRYYTWSRSFSGLRFTIGLITIQNETATVSSNVLPYRDLSENIFRSPDEVFAAVARLSSLTVTQTVDPYSPVGPSEEDVGDGDFDDADDEIPMSSLPSLSFASTGFCRVYSPTLSQLSALATYMWTDQTFLQTLANHIIQLLENPMESIISLSLVPCSPTVGPAESVKVLFIPIPDVSMYPVTNQFTDVECGTLAVNEYYGSALDYNPYTKISCFLPFIGMVELDTDEVMGKTLGITYRIDVVSGACTAIIKANGDVYYQFSGHCSVQMPITSADFSGYVSAIMSTAKLVAGLGASAAGAPVLGGAILGAPPIGSKSTTQTTTSGGEATLTTRNPETGRQVISGRVTTKPQTKETVHTPGGMNFGELAVRSTANTVGAVMNSKAGIQHSGGFSGISGYLGVRYPYLVIKRPRLCNPDQYGQYNGRPSMIYANLGSCTGYTEVQSIQLTGIPATNPEMSEIAELLKSGVIL